MRQPAFQWLATWRMAAAAAAAAAVAVKFASSSPLRQLSKPCLRRLCPSAQQRRRSPWQHSCHTAVRHSGGSGGDVNRHVGVSGRRQLITALTAAHQVGRIAAGVKEGDEDDDDDDDDDYYMLIGGDADGDDDDDEEADGTDDDTEEEEGGDADMQEYADQSDAQYLWRKFNEAQARDLLYSCLRTTDLRWCGNRSCFITTEDEGAMTPPQLQLHMPPSMLPASHPTDPVEYLVFSRRWEDDNGGVGGTGVSPRRYLLTLLTADSAALGVWEAGRLIRHKVLTAYTVRRGQGTSQRKHQRGGGRERTVGQHLRARESARLVTRICEKLNEWIIDGDVASCSQLFRSGDVRIWNEVSGWKKPALRVRAEDERWRRVEGNVSSGGTGGGIRRPRLRELRRVHFGVTHGRVGIRVDAKSEGRRSVLHDIVAAVMMESPTAAERGNDAKRKKC